MSKPSSKPWGGRFQQATDPTVERFSARSVLKSADSLPELRAYLGGLRTGGGTNLDGALGVDQRLVHPADRRERLGVALMCVAAVGIQLDRARELRQRLDEHGAAARPAADPVPEARRLSDADLQHGLACAGREEEAQAHRPRIRVRATAAPRPAVEPP